MFAALGACVGFGARFRDVLRRPYQEWFGLAALAYALFALWTSARAPEVDHAGHLGGLLGGLVMGLLLPPLMATMGAQGVLGVALVPPRQRCAVFSIAYSLAMALFWSTCWGLLFANDRKVAWVAFGAALSHFFADFPMHDGDLPLFPTSDLRLGGHLWSKLGLWSWVLEGVFCAGVLAWAQRQAQQRRESIKWPAVAVGVLLLQLSPWTSPMALAAELTEPNAHLAHAALVLLGGVLPALVVGWLLDQSRRVVPA